MSDRKYRQPGYQDRGSQGNEVKAPPRVSRENTYGPRAIQMAPTRTVSRCAQCGVLLPATVDPQGQCPQCGAALHSCRQCVNFDPGSRFECRLTIAGYSKKDQHNDCPSFALRGRVERETSAAVTRVEDARKAFENLFKKS